MIFSYLCGSVQHFTNDIDLQMEAAPRFQPLPNSDLLFNFSHRESTHVEVNDPSFIDEEREKRIFRRSSISIKGGSYQNMAAFGFGRVYGSGGVLFGLLTSLEIIENANFTNNSANVGGSISLLSSTLYINQATFNGDIAYRHSGSLYVASQVQSGYVDVEDELGSTIEQAANTPSEVVIFDTKFERCLSKQFFGAASFSSVKSLYIEGSIFHLCRAVHSGGAIGIINTMATICRSCFYQNEARHDEFEKIYEHTYDPNIQQSPRSISRPKGGGAIYVETINQVRKWYSTAPKIELYTYKCFWRYNFAQFTYSQEYKNNNKIDQNILFVGSCFYRSYEDNVDIYEYITYGYTTMSSFVEFYNQSSEYIKRVKPSILNDPDYSDSQNTLSMSVYPLEEFRDKEDQCDFDREGNHYVDLQSYTETDNTAVFTGDYTTVDPSQSSIPTTPMTRLPYKTTSSMSLPYTIQQFDTPTALKKIRSVTPTLSMSPTCSTGQGGVPDIVLTYPSGYGPTNWDNFEYSPVASDFATQTSVGATWPKQTPNPTQTDIPVRTRYGNIPDPTISTPSQSWWGESPRPLPTVSLSFQGETTYQGRTPYVPTKVPAQTELPEDVAVSYTTRSLTLVNSLSLTWSETVGPDISYSTLTIIEIQTVTYDSGQVVKTVLPLETIFDITTYTHMPALVPTVVASEQALDIVIPVLNLEPEDDDYTMLIIIIVVAAVVVVALVIGILLFLKKKKNDSGEAHEIEIPEETVVEIADSSVAPVTQDNPLWTSAAAEESDDPFKHDFEEDTTIALTTNSM